MIVAPSRKSAALRTQTERRRLVNAPLKQLGRAWAIGPFPDGGRGLATVHPPEQGPIDLAATYGSQAKTLAWQPVKNERAFDFIKAFGPSADGSFYAYCRVTSPVRQQMMLLPGSDDGLKIWQNGKQIWTYDGVRAALPLQDVVYLDLQPGSNDLLFRVNNVDGACELYVHYRTLREVERGAAGEVRQWRTARTAQVGRRGWRHDRSRVPGDELA